jgi:hypothetical protein
LNTTLNGRTNGHSANGRGAINRGAAAPLAAVGDGTVPDSAEPAHQTAEAPPAGRDTTTGRFIPGNKAACGNPHARRVAALRSALLGALTEEHMARLAEALFTQALAGDTAAAKLLLSYAIGKPAPAVDPDRLDLDALDLLRLLPTQTEVVRLLAERVGAEEAAGMVLSLLPAMFQTFTRRVCDGLDRQAQVREMTPAGAAGSGPAGNPPG